MSPASYEILVFALHCFSGAASFGFFYLALFTYPDESDRLVNRLEDLWVRIAGESQGLLVAQANLVKISSSFITQGLSWVLGARLISVQAIAVSFSLSYSSLLILTCGQNGYSSVQTAAMLMGSVGLFAYGAFAVRKLCLRKMPSLALGIPLVLYLLISSYGFFQGRLDDQVFSYSNLMEWAVELGFSLAALGFGVLCDLLLLVANRMILRSMSVTRKLSVLLWGFIYNLVWVGFLVASIWDALNGGRMVERIADYLVPGSSNSLILQSSDVLSWIVAALVQAAFESNLFTLAVSTGLFLLVLVALGHRIFWPSAERLIYALYQWKVFKDRKLQIALGFALLLFAFPNLHAVVARFKP
ncbi:MAG: hypothetical protein ACLGP3_11255 [Acidobacteriota bacterium]